MPTASDLVTDLPADFETFGQAVATSMADLLGGTTGQVLSKASNTDMDFTWVAQDDSNAIQNAIVDAKGDLIAATAADTPARLAVGANNTVLTADSSTATGLKWVGFQGASVYGVAQTIANNTWTAINFGYENFDTDSFHSTVTNNSRLTIPTGLSGKYLIMWQQRWDPSGSGTRDANIYKNGTSITTQNMTASSTYASNAKTAIFELNAGDYVELYVYQGSGGNLICYPRGEDLPFQIQFLGA
jgi:hypothetical protein